MGITKKEVEQIHKKLGKWKELFAVRGRAKNCLYRSFFPKAEESNDSFIEHHLTNKTYLSFLSGNDNYQQFEEIILSYPNLPFGWVNYNIPSFKYLFMEQYSLAIQVFKELFVSIMEENLESIKKREYDSVFFPAGSDLLLTDKIKERVYLKYSRKRENSFAILSFFDDNGSFQYENYLKHLKTVIASYITIVLYPDMFEKGIDKLIKTIEEIFEETTLITIEGLDVIYHYFPEYRNDIIKLVDFCLEKDCNFSFNFSNLSRILPLIYSLSENLSVEKLFRFLIKIENTEFIFDKSPETELDRIFAFLLTVKFLSTPTSVFYISKYLSPIRNDLGKKLLKHLLELIIFRVDKNYLIDKILNQKLTDDQISELVDNVSIYKVNENIIKHELTSIQTSKSLFPRIGSNTIYLNYPLSLFLIERFDDIDEHSIRYYSIEAINVYIHLPDRLQRNAKVLKVLEKNIDNFDTSLYPNFDLIPVKKVISLIRNIKILPFDEKEKQSFLKLYLLYLLLYSEFFDFIEENEIFNEIIRGMFLYIPDTIISVYKIIDECYKIPFDIPSEIVINILQDNEIEV